MEVPDQVMNSNAQIALSVNSGGLSETEKWTPLICMVAVALCLLISLYWVLHSFAEHRALKSSWNSSASFQLYTWLTSFIDLFLLLIAIGSHWRFESRNWNEITFCSPCMSRYFASASVFIRILTMSSLAWSIMLRFYSFYCMLGSSRIIKVYTWVFRGIIVSTLVSITSFAATLPFFGLEGRWYSICKVLRFAIHSSTLVIVSIGVISYGMRFILQRLSLLHKKVPLSHRSLWKAYLCLSFPAVVGSFYVGFLIMCVKQPTLMSEILRVTIAAVLLEVSLIGYMIAIKTFSNLVSKCVRDKKAIVLDSKDVSSTRSTAVPPKV
jgi:hypothetical protein